MLTQNFRDNILGSVSTDTQVLKIEKSKFTELSYLWVAKVVG